MNWPLFFSLCLVLPALSTPFDDTPVPVDYLVPPPVASISSRAIPGPSPSHQNVEEPSFFNRITNWMFSFGRSYEPPKDKYIASPSEKVVNYQKPAKPFHTDKTAVDDPSCSPCNKIPWVPIFPKNTPQTPNDLNRPLPPIKYLASTLPPTMNEYLPPSSPNSYQSPSSPQPISYQSISSPQPTSYQSISSPQPTAYQPQNSYQSTSTFIQEASISFSTQPAFFGSSQPTSQPTTPRPLDLFQKFTFTTTQRPFRNQEPFRGITSPEYLPPRQVLPIENENRPYAPIPLPNLSMTPIPPLHEAIPFLQDSYRNSPYSGKFIPTFANGTKYIEGLNVRMPPILTPFTSPNIATIQSSPNVEIQQSLPVVEFQHTTIEDNYSDVKTTSQATFFQYTTSTSRPIEETSSNIYHGKLTDGQIDTNRQTSILDTPILHFNKSETNVLPIIVSYHNNDTNNNQDQVQTQNSIITKEKVMQVKPLRYIIPYTTQQRPQPFKAKHLRNQQGGDTATEFSEWAPQRSLDQDLHDTQESSIVTATAPTPPSTIKTTKYIAKFLASSIKELLNKERIERVDTTEGTTTTDVTTEEVTEMTTNVPTTTTEEITTTTTSTTTTTTTEATTSSTTSTTTTTTTTPSTTTTTSTEIPPPTTTKIESVPFDFVTFQENINKWTEEQFAETNEIPGSATTLEMVKYTKPIPVEYITESTLLPKITVVTPQNYVATTSPSPTTPKHRPTYSDTPFVDSVLLDRLKSSFKQAKAYSSYSYRNHAEQWKKVQVTISPLTKEKIYIVTPQTIITNDEDAEIFPRFKKRPTPGRGVMNF